MKPVLVSVSLLVLVVNSHPICTSDTNHGDQACTDIITTNKMFLDKWLDVSDNSKGIDQLRQRSRNSVASKLLNLASTSVSHFYLPFHMGTSYYFA